MTPLLVLKRKAKVKMTIRHRIIISVIAVLANLVFVSCDSNVESTRSFEPDIAENQQVEVLETTVDSEITTEPMPTIIATPQIPDTPDVTDKQVDEETYEPMEVHFIDVGEADSTLIICGEEAMLIDTGNPDMGTAVRLYLKKQNVTRLKYLLLTHSDKDHIGGAASVVSNVPIDNLFMCRYEKDNEVYLNLINEINYKNMTWSTPDVGTELALGDANITVIAPNRDYDNPNDSSIGVIIRHGEDSFIFTGDAETPAEEDILNNGLDLSADVYHVGHHGSRTASSDAFLDKINPEYAIISCETDNKYGHPHFEVMEKLQNRGVKLYRIDKQGTIIAYSDGKNITFNMDPSDDWEPGTVIESDDSASTQVKEALAEASQAPVEETDVRAIPKEEEKTEITYVLNTNTKKFHIPTCDSVNDMKEKNKMEVTLSREEIIEQGYKPCGKCKP